jgi:hypothetical protein
MRHPVVARWFGVEIDLFYNELAFLVLLIRFVGLEVRPTHQGLTTLAKDITNSMEARDESALFGRSLGDIDTTIE